LPASGPGPLQGEAFKMKVSFPSGRQGQLLRTFKSFCRGAERRFELLRGRRRQFNRGHRPRERWTGDLAASIDQPGIMRIRRSSVALRSSYGFSISDFPSSSSKSKKTSWRCSSLRTPSGDGCDSSTTPSCACGSFDLHVDEQSAFREHDAWAGRSEKLTCAGRSTSTLTGCRPGTARSSRTPQSCPTAR
jgi:hypothetical protein